MQKNQRIFFESGFEYSSTLKCCFLKISFEYFSTWKCCICVSFAPGIEFLRHFSVRIRHKLISDLHHRNWFLMMNHICLRKPSLLPKTILQVMHIQSFPIIVLIHILIELKIFENEKWKNCKFSMVSISCKCFYPKGTFYNLALISLNSS